MRGESRVRAPALGSVTKEVSLGTGSRKLSGCDPEKGKKSGATPAQDGDLWKKRGMKERRRGQIQIAWHPPWGSRRSFAGLPIFPFA
jgi:hypothetical protein